MKTILLVSLLLAAAALAGCVGTIEPDPTHPPASFHPAEVGEGY